MYVTANQYIKNDIFLKFSLAVVDTYINRYIIGVSGELNKS